MSKHKYFIPKHFQMLPCCDLVIIKSYFGPKIRQWEVSLSNFRHKKSLCVTRGVLEHFFPLVSDCTSYWVCVCVLFGPLLWYKKEDQSIPVFVLLLRENEQQIVAQWGVAVLYGLVKCMNCHVFHSWLVSECRSVWGLVTFIELNIMRFGLFKLKWHLLFGAAVHCIEFWWVFNNLLKTECFFVLPALEGFKIPIFLQFSVRANMTHLSKWSEQGICVWVYWCACKKYPSFYFSVFIRHLQQLFYL